MTFPETKTLAAETPPPLASVARRALIWSGGVTLIRDVLQFASMLILIRLLSKEDYGRVALAQTIWALLAVVSFKTFITHAYQSRDPDSIDWQAQLTGGLVLNCAIFILTLFVAGVLSFSSSYGGAALPLAILSVVFLIEIPSNLRQTMLQVSHDWRRLQSLVMIGTVGAFIAGIAIALLGGGLWALIVPNLLIGIPAVVDLILCTRWRPDFSWSWDRYRSTAWFGTARMGSALFLNGRQTVEQATVASVYDFSTLGVFSRSIGLATFVVGRLGPMIVWSLYPIFTRADPRSGQLCQISNFVFRTVAWLTIPAATFISISARDAVTLLYGPQWTEVAQLLPAAAGVGALHSLSIAAYSLLLANNEARVCLVIDLFSAALAVALVAWLVPLSPKIYLFGLVIHGLLIVVILLMMLTWTKGIKLGSIFAALCPPVIASATAVCALMAIRATLTNDVLIIRLAAEGVVFGITFLAILRAGFSGWLAELIFLAPNNWRLDRVLFLKRLRNL